ncbi:hypothetical protein FRC07_009706 [Ceratobasidium sp. 392]|nr:hypothetical protein FRC07_009706 [Ceratobasidium sp. 392]
MASTQVDRLDIPAPPASSDLVGRYTSVEHVASGSFSPTQDADSLREAALRSRRAKKQSSLAVSSQALSTTPQPVNDVAKPIVAGEDVQMEDATARPVADDMSGLHPVRVDAEDGEILEDVQTNNAGGDETIGIDRPEQAGLLGAGQSGDLFPLGHSSEPPEPPLDNIEFVRPSLNMTARDLDEAKRLILDLLGLGVTPEYLVDCGISSQCLAVCFYEMNLRFPLNLDRNQINLPSFYDIDKHMKASIKRDRAVRQRDQDQAVEKLLNALPKGSRSPVPQGLALPSLDRSASTHKQKRGSLPSPPVSLPAKPAAHPPKKDELSYSTESIAAQPRADTRSPPTGPRASDVLAEDQKRMELLARKAAMDSITRKRAAKSSPKPSSGDLEQLAQPSGIEQDVESAVDALLAAVRMNPVSMLSERDGMEKEPYSGERSKSFESDVDETLPDYDSDAMVEDELDTRSTSVSDVGDNIPHSPASIFGARLSSSPAYSSPVVPEYTPLPQVPPAVPSPRTRFESLDRDIPSSSFTPPLAAAVPIAARKSRPTASDFIDQTPPRPSSALTSESDRNTLLKRKRCFVDPQVWPRRLIIDLDSSDEEEQDEVEGRVQPSADAASASSSRGSVERTMSSGGSTRPSNDRGRDMATQMLLEKELQIKAMMQKIKMRELKKKLGSASGSGTPLLVPASAVPAPEEPAALPPPPSVTSPPNEPLGNETAAMEATKQEITKGVTSTLEIQQETGLSHTEVPDFGDNTLGSDLDTSLPKLDKGKEKAVEPDVIVEGSEGMLHDKRRVSSLTRSITSEDSAQPGHPPQPIQHNISRIQFASVLRSMDVTKSFNISLDTFQDV